LCIVASAWGSFIVQLPVDEPDVQVAALTGTEAAGGEDTEPLSQRRPCGRGQPEPDILAEAVAPDGLDPLAVEIQIELPVEFYLQVRIRAGMMVPRVLRMYCPTRAEFLS